ncbi:ROK family transcriptional regulator [Nonomuraea soli]|uniref:Putative NBD/HSP70 family sugar kinase n=1 Tax=Nonomuraea soli TaxID=1032476 RepID=A0A7W0CMX0_9ACTN|nr:ROK family transcriptional regulator [Nonomuraea soli]MBA2893900.1 putative NBD/HSP70 family sugar kinase [Nonomuraea soli]
MQVSGGDLQRLRQLNSLSSIRALRESRAPLTLTELSAQTGLSRASVGDVVTDLHQRGWITEVEPTPGTMGRPAKRYRFRADAGHVLGIDIGVHKVLAVVTDLTGRIVASGRVAVDRNTTRPERLEAVWRAVEAALVASGLAAADLWGVTAGSVGVVSREGVVTRVEALPDWPGVDLAGHLGERLSCPITIENDSKLAALAEQRLGVAAGVQDLVYLHVGRRPGAALILSGRLHHGFSGATGEVGLMDITGWRTMAVELEGCPVADGAPPEEAARLVFGAARAGDAVAQEAVDVYARRLALGTAAMVLTLDPELVILGGGFSRSADVLLPALQRALEPHCLRVPAIRPSTLGEECVALGGACLALDQVAERFFSSEGSLASPVAPQRLG